MMRRLSFVLSVFVLAALTRAQGGMPGNCQCSSSPVVDTFPVSDASVGNASNTAYCVVNTGGTTCRMVGTITLNFNPTGTYSLTHATWGMPTTDISGLLTAGGAGTYYFTHPGTAYEYCDDPNRNYEAWSIISIIGTFNSTSASLIGIRTYACTTS